MIDKNNILTEMKGLLYTVLILIRAAWFLKWKLKTRNWFSFQDMEKRKFLLETFKVKFKTVALQ